MKHNRNFINIFNKNELIMVIVSFSIFALLGAFISFYVYIAGFIFLMFAIVPPIMFFYKAVTRELGKVYRITVKDGVPRWNVEYWEKKEINKLPQSYFWIENNKYLPVIHDNNGEINPLNPFEKSLSKITSGHIQRSGVHKGVKFLFSQVKMGVGEALFTIGIFATIGALFFIDWMMLGRLLEAN
tara:strand:+ start:2160 stop:2714 length:555 start_codon:yes stop_codon:yes gene_type:complete